MNAVIKTLNNPRLNILKGSEMTERIGFMTLNPIAKRIPPTMRVLMPPCNTSPEKSIWVMYKENAYSSTFRKIPRIPLRIPQVRSQSLEVRS